MLDAVNDPNVWRVVFMTGSAVGKTSALDAILGYFVDQDPSPALLVLPTLSEAEKHSKERLAPLIEETPALRRRFGDMRSRDAGNTLLHKEFPGGYLALAGANSAASLSRRHCRIVACDEVDSFPASADNQGDPVSLAMQRTTRFWNRVVILAGTPTVRGVSRLEKAWDESDRRRFFIPCPACAAYQVLTWASVVWDEGRPETAGVRCEGCSRRLGDLERLEAIRRGEWRATAPFTGTAGFHVWEAYATPRLSDLVAEFLEKKKHRESLQTFVNLRLGELWENDEGESIPWAEIRNRAEEYEPLTIPDSRIGLLVAGVDVQADRLAVLILGFGPGEETWVIGWFELFGDTIGDEVWRELDELLLRREFTAPASGARFALTAAIDSGYRPQRVYAYVRERSPRMFATKGSNQPGRPILGRPTLQDVEWSGRTIPNGVQLWPVGTDTAKGEIYARLRIAEPGPRFIHFPASLPADFYEQLTAERLVTRYSRGVPRLEWHLPPGKRNEALDCFVCAYAAAIRAGIARMDWAQFDRQLRDGGAVRSGRRLRSPGISL